jgi:alpha-L-fucosidase
MGNWLKQNGYTIYGSHAGYMKPQAWGAITEKGNTIWLHLFKTDGDKFFVKMPYQVKNARAGDQPLKVQSLEGGYIMINLKGIALDPVDTIVQLEVIK